MHKTLLASAAVLGLALATPAFAQDNAPATGAMQGGTMPQSNLSTDDSPANFLQAARQAVRRRQGGLAAASLGRAETRLLDRAVMPGAANEPDNSPAVQEIERARAALARHDWQTADQHIAAALQQAQMAGSGTGMGQGAAAGTAPGVGASGSVATAPATVPAGGMTQGTGSAPMGGVMPPNGGVMQPNTGVMPSNEPTQ